MSVFMQPIYTATVGAGGVASVTFNNIPQGFTDLKLVISAKTNWASNNWDDLVVRFNDTTSGYSENSVFVVNSVTPISGQASNVTYAQVGWSANTNFANVFSNSTTTITNYTNGNAKNVMTDTAIEGATATTVMGFISYVWNNTAPITKMTFSSLNSATILQYTTITLYGVSGVYDTARPTAPAIGTVTDQAAFASVAFTPAANDQAESYAVTTNPATSTTYGARSPIVVGAVLGTSTTYQVASVNALGTGASAVSSALTTFNSYASIATIAVNASILSVTFTNIPQNYSHLQLRCYSRSATGTYSQLDMNFNGDSSNAYTYHTAYGDGANAGSGNSSPRSNIPQVADLVQITSIPGASIIDILDYTSVSKFKTTRWLYGSDVNGTGGIVGIGSSAYMSFTPINSITLTGRSQNIGQYSHFALYGIA
jgi:hypothetical protein